MNQPAALYTAQGIRWRREGHAAPPAPAASTPYTVLSCKDGHLRMITRSGQTGMNRLVGGWAQSLDFAQGGGRGPPNGDDLSLVVPLSPAARA